MSKKPHFKMAARAETVGGWIFWAVTGATLLLTLAEIEPLKKMAPWLESPNLKHFIEALLVVGALGAVFCTALTMLGQSQGNRVSRDAQIAEGIGVNLWPLPPSDYYDSPLAPSVRRLASTTFESAYHTVAVLDRMLRPERIRLVTFLFLLVFFFAVRWPAMSVLVVLSQAVFSGDLVLQWLRMERYRNGATELCTELRQYFQQAGPDITNEDVAFVVNFFARYECLKDEAGLPLDSDIFKALKSGLEQGWKEEMVRTRITKVFTPPTTKV